MTKLQFIMIQCEAKIYSISECASGLLIIMPGPTKLVGVNFEQVLDREQITLIQTWLYLSDLSLGQICCNACYHLRE